MPNDIKADLKRYTALEAFPTTEVGKYMIPKIKGDIEAQVSALCSVFKEESHANLVSRIATIAALRDFLAPFETASRDKDTVLQAMKE